MFSRLFLLALAPAAPLQNARQLIEWQLRSPPRAPEHSGLSAEEAAIVRNRYLQSIGERPPQPAEREQ